MRRVLNCDVSAVARALWAVSRRRGHRVCTKILAEAELADLRVRRKGRSHPSYGNGTLMAAACARSLADDKGFDNPEFCQCFEMVLHHLIRFQLSRTRN